jgi:hypothetical protein
LSQQLRAGSMAKPISLLCLLAWLVALPASAAANRSLAAPEDVVMTFRDLAQQRPWTCAAQAEDVVPRTGWAGGVAECAWQNRLRMRHWSGTAGAATNACISSQAQWWAWLRAASPAAARASAAWRSTWASQSFIDERGVEQRIVIVRRLLSGEWSVTEWRWNPSARAATRRWQEDRWKLLAARAEQLRAPVEAQYGPLEARMLRGVLDLHLANRVSEIGSQTWRWQADGLCLNVDAVGLGQQIMQLPYSADDSRMEQRAAMQLQLARRYPKAVWLAEFGLVPAAARARGGAKFQALWIEHASLNGQLWIPTRGNGPLVRLRVTTALPVAAGGQAKPQDIARAEQVVQQELTGLASRWAAEHE